MLQKKSTKLIRQEYMDYDYIDKLDDKTKQWLADFTNEYYNASVGKQKDKGKNNRFHKSKKEVKDCQHRNNLRNNDVYGKAKAKNNIVHTHNAGTYDPEIRNKYNKIDEVENALVDYLDHKKDLKKTGQDTD